MIEAYLLSRGQGLLRPFLVVGIRIRGAARRLYDDEIGVHLIQVDAFLPARDIYAVERLRRHGPQKLLLSARGSGTLQPLGILLALLVLQVLQALGILRGQGTLGPKFGALSGGQLVLALRISRFLHGEGSCAKQQGHCEHREYHQRRTRAIGCQKFHVATCFLQFEYDFGCRRILPLSA